MSDSQTSHLHRALKLAFKAHKHQNRDGTSPLPYITHPIDVVNRLRYVGDVQDEYILCAAALHDTLEETDLPPDTIFREFGSEVMDLVFELTREEPDYSEKDLSAEEIWHLRSQILIDEVGRMSPAAQTIKLADRASNLTSAWLTREGEKLTRYIKQTEWILKKIPREVNPALWDEVDRLRQPRG